MTRSVSLLSLILAISGAFGCAPSGNDTNPSGTLIGAGTGGGGAGKGSSGAAGNSAADVTSNGGSGSAAGSGASTSTGTAGAAAGSGGSGAAGAAGSGAGADPIQAVDDGVNAYQGGDYAGAIMNLMASLAADPNGPSAPAAHYYIARSQQQLSDCTAAVAGYQMFLQSYPDDEFADDAQFRIGECACANGDYTTGLAELQKVLDNYADSDAANDAQYTIGLCYLDQAQAMAPGASRDTLLGQARDACQAAIDDYPDRSGGTTSPWAQVCVGLTYHEAGDCAAELAAMQKVISDYPIDAGAVQGCVPTAEHVGACNVNSQRQGAIDEANRHISDLGLAIPAQHTCI